MVIRGARQRWARGGVIAPRAAVARRRPVRSAVISAARRRPVRSAVIAATRRWLTRSLVIAVARQFAALRADRQHRVRAVPETAFPLQIHAGPAVPRADTTIFSSSPSRMPHGSVAMRCKNASAGLASSSRSSWAAMHARSPPEAAPRLATRPRSPSSSEQVRERARAPNAVNRHDERSVSIRQSSYGVAIDGAHTLLGWFCDGAAIDRRRHYSNRGPQGSTVARGIFAEWQSTYRSSKNRQRR